MTETTKISEALLDSWITWYAGEHDSPFSNSVAAALRELKALRQENEWISVETRMPKFNTKVLVACYTTGGRWSQVSYSRGDDRWDDVEGGVRVKFWRPLHTPPAPRTEEK